MYTKEIVELLLEKFQRARQKRLEFMKDTDSTIALLQLQEDLERIEHALKFWEEQHRIYIATDI